MPIGVLSSYELSFDKQMFLAIFLPYIKFISKHS